MDIKILAQNIVNNPNDFTAGQIEKYFKDYAEAISAIVIDSLPDFLYEDEGEIKVGVYGDSSVTDEWNKWKESINYKSKT